MINLFFLLLYIAASQFVTGSDMYLLLTLHCVVLMIYHLRKKLNPISPIFIYYVGVIIVNIGNVSLISLIESGTHIRTYSYIVLRYTLDAATIWCISSTLFIIGYNLYINKMIPKISFEIKNKSVLRYMFVFLIIENILFIVGEGFNVRGNQFGKFFVLLNTIGILFYSRLWAKEGSKTYAVYAIILYILETYQSLLTSYLRFELILPTFYLFTGYFIGKGSFKYVLSYRAIPLIIILAVYGSVFNSLPKYRAGFIRVFSQEQDVSTVRYVDEQEKNASSGLLSRSANVAQMTNIVRLVERNAGPYNGRASAPILIAFIPRFLWPDKPKIQLGAWFAVEIGAGEANDYGVVNNSINMTVAGELYLDFGWIGVFIGSLFFGAFIAVLWNSTNFYSSAYNLSGTIFGGYLIMLSIGSYADLQIVVTLTSTYLIFYFIKRIFDFFQKK